MRCSGSVFVAPSNVKVWPEGPVATHSRHAVSWLHGSYRGQVFLFTSPEEGETMPEDPEIPFRKIMLD